MEHIHLNMIPDGIAEVSHASQFDNGRQIRFNIFNGDSAYTLDGTETITMVVNGVEEAVANTSDNYVVWDVDASDCEEADVIECELRIVKGSVKIGSKNFFLAVETDPYGAGPGLVIREAEGDPAEFTTNVADNAVECKIDIDYNANGYLSATVINSRTAPAFDSVPYVFRKSGGDLPSIGGQEFDTLVGCSVAFNQLVQINQTTSADVTISQNASGVVSLSGMASGFVHITNNISYVSGHKYLFLFNLLTNPNNVSFTLGSGSGDPWITNISSIGEIGKIYTNQYTTDYILYDVNGIDFSGVTFTLMTFDLTVMFGSEVADYLYNLEHNTAGEGVALFRQLFPDSYYAYQTATLISSKPTSKVVVGKNLGDFDDVNAISGGSDYPVLGSVYLFAGTYTLSFTLGSTTTGERNRPLYGIGSDVIYCPDDYYSSGRNSWTFTITTAGIYQFKWWYQNLNANCNITDYQLEFGSTATAYEPYTKTTYPLGGDELRGILKVVDGKLVAFGDVHNSDGTGTLYFEERAYQAGDESLANAITDGTNTVVALTTPTPTTYTAFTNPQIVGSTEEFTDTRTIKMPCGHDTIYGDDIKGVIVDFGHLIYGGELNLTTGTLTSTKNADGTDKVTPDVYHLTPKQVEVREGNNKIFGNTNGNTYVKYYARA